MEANYSSVMKCEQENYDDDDEEEEILKNMSKKRWKGRREKTEERRKKVFETKNFLEKKSTQTNKQKTSQKQNAGSQSNGCLDGLQSLPTGTCMVLRFSGLGGLNRGGGGSEGVR